MVGIGDIGRKHLRLACKQLFAVGVKRVPFGKIVGPGGKCGVLWDHAEFFLIGKNLLAHLIPTHVEFALELVDPLLCWMMRRMSSAGHIVNKERLVGRGRTKLLYMVNCVVGHIGDEIVTRLA